MTTINVNGKDRTVDVEEDMPLLWVIRDVLAMPGTKFDGSNADCSTSAKWFAGLRSSTMRPTVIGG